MAGSGGCNWDRLLFCIKEAVYKVWFPMTERWLGFDEEMVSIGAEMGSFSARLLVQAPTVGGCALSSFEGRWLVREGLILTAIAVARCDLACSLCPE